MSGKGRFIDRVLKFMGIEEEVAASNEVDSETSDQATDTLHYEQNSMTAQEAPEERRVFDLSADKGGSRMRMIVLEPRYFNDVQSIANHLVQKEPVLLRVDQLDKSVARRIMDFLSGTTYALDGHIQRIGDGIFLLAPESVEVDTDALSVDGEFEEELLS